MATSTLPPQTPEEQDERYNTAQKLSDAEFGAVGMSAEEKQRLKDIHETDQMAAAAEDPTKQVRDGEAASGDNPMNFQATGKRSSGIGLKDLSSIANNPAKLLSLAKKGGPAGLLIGIFVAVLGLITSFTPLLPVHIVQSALDKWDSQKTSYTIRTQKVLVAKLSNSVTEGTCTSFITIRCRFTRPSNYLLNKLDKEGIVGIDKSGNPAKRTGLWPNARPAAYRIADGQGGTRDVTAADFRNELKTNAVFRAGFNNANKTRLQTFGDSTFKSIAAKFGFTKQDKLATAKSEEDVKQTLNDESKGTDTGAKDAKDKNDTSKIKQILKKLFGDEATRETTKLADSGRGNAVGLAAGAVCLGMDAPGIVTRTARAYQMIQIIRFAMIPVVSVGAIIAGDSTSTEATSIADSLTQTDANGKSALDSFGMKNLMYGDTTPTNGDDYKKFVPGGATAATFGAAALIFDSQAKKSICAGATSPITGAIIDVALSETIVGPIINVVAGIVLSVAIEQAAAPLIEGVLDAIPAEFYDQLATMFFGNITENLSGMDYGNALASGISLVLGQISNAGGNVPLSVKDAVAYDGLTQQVNVAYAEEERATHSPLDASSNYTFMGSIVNSLIPLYSHMGSLTGALSSVSTIASTSMSGLFSSNTFAATQTAKEYELCDDPSLINTTGDRVAAGPFCNIQYGIPSKYLEMDSQDVVDALVKAGQIDENTGEPIKTAADVAADVGSTLGVDSSSDISSLYKWTQLCTDGTTAQAVNCKIGGDAATAREVITAQTAVATNGSKVKLAADTTDNTNDLTALYAIYTIDHRIQRNMDDEDIEPVAETDDTSGSVTETGGTKQALAKAILDSGKVSFLEGVNSSAAARKKIFQDIADGKTDGDSLSCGLNIKVLQLVKFLVDNHKSLMIGDTNSLCTGATQGRWAGSRHIGGNGSAVDINMIDGVTVNGGNAQSIALLKEIKPLLSTGNTISEMSQVGQVECRAHLDLGAVSQINDACSHVHIDFPVKDDPGLKTTNGAY